MNHTKKYFIQYMLYHGMSTIEDAITFCKSVSQDLIRTPSQFKNLIGDINTQIMEHSFKIVYDVCEVNNKEVIIWINTKNDEISKLQVTFTPLDLEYFHVILQEILGTDQHHLGYISCLNIASTLTAPMTRTHGQNLLEKWAKMGYYIQKDGKIYLGSRLIVEFNAYLKEQAPDSICNLCSELVFTGKQCTSCHTTLHSICLSKYLERQNKCPYCHSEWIQLRNSENEYRNSPIVQNSMDVETMEVTEEVPENILNDYAQLNKQYTNNSSSQMSSQVQTRHSNRNRIMTITQQDLLEAGPSSKI